MEDAEHGFQLGEVGSPCRDDQASVKELTVQFLDLFERMLRAGKPFFCRPKIFVLLGWPQ